MKKVPCYATFPDCKLGIGAVIPLQAQAESIHLGYPGLSINLGSIEF